MKSNTTRIVVYLLVLLSTLGTFLYIGEHQPLWGIASGITLGIIGFAFGLASLIFKQNK